MYISACLCGSPQLAFQGRLFGVFSDPAKGGPRDSPTGRKNAVAAYSFPNDSQNLRRAAMSGIQYRDNFGSGEKQIAAEVSILAPIEEVWAILTNYESLPTFVPNLERCERLSSPEPQTVFLKQVGCTQGVLWRIEAQGTLCVQEVKVSSWRREVWFRMIEGDFEEFYGRWIVESDLSSSAQLSTFLRYEATVVPRFELPTKIVSYIVKAGLPVNIRAIAMKAEELASARLRASGLASWAGTEEDPDIPDNGGQTRSQSMQVDGRRFVDRMPISGILDCEPEEMLIPAKAPFWPLGSRYSAAAPITSKRQAKKAMRDAAKSSYLGISWVPLPPSGTPEISVKEALNQQVRSKEKSLIVPRIPNTHPPLGCLEEPEPATLRFSRQNSSSLAFNGIEIHLRRLDGLEYWHRRLVASIRIDAPGSSVWQVISDYDNLANFVPNLASSERIRLPTSAPKNVLRVRQVGYKNISYLCLHAESVMDLVEKEQSEIQFRQVAGDFDKFQGKWMVQERPQMMDGDQIHLGPTTILKYAVEVVIPKSTCLHSVLEPIFERVVFEDLSRNLFAIKSKVESKVRRNKCRTLNVMPENGKELDKPKLSEMIASFDIFRIEMDKLFGDKQIIPSRSELRKSNRTDIEKAIAAHGGPATVADRMGWTRKGRYRKPKGYWNSISNVKQEIDEFISIYDLPPGIMPIKNDFIRANRFDLARAIERWGGLYCLAEQLGYKVATGSQASSFNLETRVQGVDTSISSANGCELLSTPIDFNQSRVAPLAETTDKPQNASTRIDEDVVASKEKSFPSARDEIDAW